MEALSEPVAKQFEAAIIPCQDSCKNFKALLDYWTFAQRGWNTILSPLSLEFADRATSLSSRPNCGSDLNTGIDEGDGANMPAAADMQLGQMGAKLGALCLARPNGGDADADRASAINQGAMEQKALGESRQLLKELLLVIQAAAASARASRGTTATFGCRQSE